MKLRKKKVSHKQKNKEPKNYSDGLRENVNVDYLS